MNKNIIPGYNGIMDLDLTNIISKHHKQAIEHHFNDIKLYILEQNKLKPEYRYENTIKRINKKQEYENYMRSKHLYNINKLKIENNQIYNDCKKLNY
jgi:hypothetical protein